MEECVKRFAAYCSTLPINAKDAISCELRHLQEQSVHLSQVMLALNGFHLGSDACQEAADALSSDVPMMPVQVEQVRAAIRGLATGPKMCPSSLACAQVEENIGLSSY